jgi:hypothetical protein
MKSAPYLNLKQQKMNFFNKVKDYLSGAPEPKPEPELPASIFH